MLDVIRFAQELVRHASVTPNDDGCLELISKHLVELGFTCHRCDNNGVSNLYARLGDGRPNFCFLGHTDVVPAGDHSLWSVDPFAGTVRNGYLYGRGISDMKGAIAAFVGAVENFLEKGSSKCSISLLLTSDEEGVARYGTRVMVDWLKERNETIDACLVGEPTNPHHLGEMIKIGRRGILDGTLTIAGKAGHVAYPEFAQNPINLLVDVCETLKNTPLDDGFPEFQPSHLEITTIDVDNAASNVIPERATAHINVRFNPSYTGEKLKQYLEELINESINGHRVNWQLDCNIGGEAFLTKNTFLRAIITEAIKHVTGINPTCSTTGGTSDARFIRDICPVVEFGLISDQAHKIDERVKVSDIEMLTKVYTQTLISYCQNSNDNP